MQSQTTVEEVVDEFKTAVLDVAEEILDNYRKNTTGFEYEGPPRIDDGVLIIGRDESKSTGVDYIFRKMERRPENETEARRRGQTITETTTFFSEKYGWVDRKSLVEEGRIFEQAVEQATEKQLVFENGAAFVSALNKLDTTLTEKRNSVSLDDVEQRILDYDLEFLKNNVATDSDDEDEFFKLLYSVDNGEKVENTNLKVPYNDGELLVARSTRFYVDEGESNEYSVAYVVGFDDTPDRFFVHRLASDSAVSDPDYEWTLADIKERMGFDRDFDRIVGNTLPIGEVVRLQGDLAVIRHDYEEEKEKYRRYIEDKVRNAAVREYGEDYNQQSDFNLNELPVQLKRSDYSVTEDLSTSGLKELQEKVSISEQRVREEQRHRGIDRLSAQRRAEIIEYLLSDNVYQWILETDISAIDGSSSRDRRLNSNSPTSYIQYSETVNRQKLYELIDETVSNSFTSSDTEWAAFGNHLVAIEPVTIHPVIQTEIRGENELHSVVASESGSGLIHHDEHEDVIINVEPGVYEFRFLSGFRDRDWVFQTQS